MEEDIFKEHKNDITTWTQGRFVDSPRYKGMTEEQKQKHNYEESFLVRPSPTDNAICRVFFPEDAKWIAARLNSATYTTFLLEDILREDASPSRKIEILEELVHEMKYGSDID